MADQPEDDLSGLRPETVQETRRMWFPRNDAARLLGVSGATIDRWRARGWLQAHKNPAGVFTYHRNDLNATMTRAQEINPRVGKRQKQQPMKRATAGVLHVGRKG